MEQIIKKDRQIKKFCFYGFFKNLQFFEPYLLIFLMMNNLSLFQIGLLITIREITINLFEIPSGIIADNVGRKKELYMCFSFYIVSYIFFFFSNGFLLASLAMLFYGLGEAFRSGTHKAMIYSYVDKMGWQEYKTYVYGKTRSFANIGTAISSLLGIIFILFVKDIKFIFILSIVPMLIDFILILSYPRFLDKVDSRESFRDFFKDIVSNFFANKNSIRILLNEGIYDATTSTMKDYIQPILKILVLQSGVLIIASFDLETNLKIILGILYFILGICGSFISKRAYKIKLKPYQTLNLLSMILFILVIFTSIFMDIPLLVICLLLIINCLINFRKPIFINELDKNIVKTSRATMLSISSQLKSFFLMIISPIIGLISDRFGVEYGLVFIGCLLLVISLITFIKSDNANIKKYNEGTKSF